MKFAALFATALVVLASVPILSATEGIFQGRIIGSPEAHRGSPVWIYVESKHHTVRRVDVSRAVFIYSDRIPVAQQRDCHSECLAPGQEVRIIAEQDKAGEWHARRVEILTLTTKRA